MIGTWFVVAGAFGYALSWLLPAAEEKTSFRGFRAFSLALFAPFADEWTTSLIGQVRCLASALTNFVVAGALVHIVLASWQPHVAWWLALFACGVLNIHFFLWRNKSFTLRGGYYLWLLSFFLIAAGMASAPAVTFVARASIVDWVFIAIAAGVVGYAIVLAWEQLRDDLAGVARREKPLLDSPMAVQSPLDLRLAVFLSGTLCVLAAVVVHVTVAPGLSHVPVVLPLFVVFLGVILAVLSVSAWTTVRAAIVLIVSAGLAVLPSVLVVLSTRFSVQLPFFLLALAFWVAVGCVALDDGHKNLGSFLRWLLGASTVVLVYCEVGLYGPIPFAAQPMSTLDGLALAVDFRIALSVVFATLCVGVAAVRAFGVTIPDVRRIPVFQLPRLAATHTVLAPLTNPLIAVLDGLLLLVISLANIIVGFVVELLLRLLRIGYEFAKLLWHLLVEEHAALGLVKSVGTMVITFGVIIASLQLSPQVQAYLRASVGGFVHLPAIGMLIFVIVLGATVIALIVDGQRVLLGRILYAASLLSVLLVFAGGIVYVLGFLRVLSVVGFERLGPVSIAAASLMSLGVMAVLAINIAERRRGKPSEAA